LNRVFAAALALLVTAAIAIGAPGGTAKAVAPTGTSTLTHAGQTTPITAGTKFEEHDIIRVGPNARLTVEYDDQSTLAIVGPAAIRFGEINPRGRRLVLANGTISEATVHGIAVEIQAPNPHDASMVLQNARGFARVNPGDRITFEKLEGVFAKVWRGNKYTDLGANAWTLNTRDGTVTVGGSATADRGRRTGVGKEEVVGDDTVRVIIGDKAVSFHPASAFGREMTQDGGLKLTYNGTGDSWGVVEIGNEVTTFVAPGQSIEFGSNGDVTRFSGIAHEYGRLFTGAGFWDEPIENAVDASPEYSKDR
jgi:hypothetical protein